MNVGDNEHPGDVLPVKLGGAAAIDVASFSSHTCASAAGYAAEDQGQVDRATIGLCRRLQP